MATCNRPVMAVKNGLKPIKQAKIEYLKRKPARERGLFVWKFWECNMREVC